MYTQENRLISIHTPLGKDVLLLKSLQGTEGLSKLFTFRLQLYTEGADIPFRAIIGQPVTLFLEGPDTDPRYFHGVINQFAHTSSETGLHHYYAEMVPWLWFLTRKTDCRIFQQMSIPDIIEQLFAELGFTDYWLSLQGNYEPVDYCVQYRETDFQFISRLMEEVGIFYFFEHGKTTHTLVIGDTPSAHPVCPGHASVRWEPPDAGQQDGDVITHVERVQHLNPGHYSMTDYNYERPHTNLGITMASQIDIGGNCQYEFFDYPGRYGQKEQGEALARVRMEEMEATQEVFRGRSTCRGFTPGTRFLLTEYLPADMNQEYMLTEVQHSASVSESYGEGEGSKAELRYTNNFVCIPAKVSFRPARVTPRSIVQGPQTAVVVGKQDEEIWTDDYGRVKVQFHWDRLGEFNEKSSCWIRVAQSWAGKRWGAFFLPRIGQEVIVEFLEGNPDRPIITGCVYNAQNLPPYDLPANQTISGIKTLSSKDGKGFNEIRFEDKKGKEQLFLHAEKDHDVRVKNNSYTTVGKDAHLLVEQDYIEEIKNDHHETIIRDRYLEIGRDHNCTIKGKQAIEVKESNSFTVKGDAVEVYKGNHAEETTGDVYMKGSNLVIEGMSNVTIKVGGSYIAIDSSGISMNGTSLIEVTSPNTTVKGDGLLTLQGGLVKIN